MIKKIFCFFLVLISKAIFNGIVSKTSQMRIVDALLIN